jgi:hypothetical protein
MGRLVATALAALLLSAMGGVQEPATRTEANTPQGVRVFNTRSVKEPKVTVQPSCISKRRAYLRSP